MRSYQVGIDYYFRELGQKIPAGSVIELRQGDAERYMVSHPGLLRPMPMTAQARPQAVRSEPAKVEIAEVPSAPEADAAPLGAQEGKVKVEAEETVDSPAPSEADQGEQPQSEEKGEAKPKGKARAKKS